MGLVFSAVHRSNLNLNSDHGIKQQQYHAAIAMLEKKLTSGEKTIILDKTKLINGCFEYDYIKDIFKIRSKSIGKPRGITSRK